jgi:hypothetical protein
MYAVFRRARAAPGSPKIRAWLATCPHCTATSSSSIPAPSRIRLAAPCSAGSAASARIAADPRPPVNDTRLIRSGPTRSMRRPATGVTSTAPAPISAKTPTAWVDSPYEGPVSSSAIAVQAALNVPNISAWYTHDRRRSGSARSNRTGAASSAP